jgi:hypothetical protein
VSVAELGPLAAAAENTPLAAVGLRGVDANLLSDKSEVRAEDGQVIMFSKHCSSCG